MGTLLNRRRVMGLERINDYSKQCLTFEALEDGAFQLSTNAVSYSLDNGETWVELAANDTSPTVTAGNKIMWKGALTPSNSGIGTFSATGNFNVQGNPMSLLYGDNYKGQTDLTGKNYAFYRLFYQNAKVINANNLSLPATTLAGNCYYDMFRDCTSLVNAPELPATTLATSCYNEMFRGCVSLTTAPELSATTLESSCYQYMFDDCTSLTIAPELPATTLVYSCYSYMFNGCKNLTTAPVLPATTLASSCYSNMFNGCTNLVIAPQLPATTLAGSCYANMFQGCTALTTAPKLPATTLAGSCYKYMFTGCTSLVTAPKLPATTLGNFCYNGMFNGCTNLVNAPELPATILKNYCYQYMFQNCTSLNYIKAMFTTTPTSTYTSNWVRGVASSGTFVKNSAATWNKTGTDGVPRGWTIETASE